jgi:hypothetical protein
VVLDVVLRKDSFNTCASVVARPPVIIDVLEDENLIVDCEAAITRIFAGIDVECSSTANFRPRRTLRWSLTSRESGWGCLNSS